MSYNLIFILLVGILSVACTKVKPKGTVILLENNKHHNAVIISTDKGSRKLDKVRESVDLIDKDTLPTEKRILSKEELKNRFGDILAIPNPKPLRYILYFKKNEMEITPSSRELIQEIRVKIVEKSPCHTDTVGSNQSNMEKSFKQAQYVTSIIKEEVLKVLKSKKNISLTTLGYGEEELLIPTPDNQANEKNRNVEIFIK